MSLERWCDYSVYQGRVGEDVLKKMVADGVVGVCVGSWHGKSRNEYAEANLRDARRLKLKTATYVAVRGGAGVEAVIQGVNACGDEWKPLKFVAVDVELAGVTEKAVCEAIDEVRFWGQRPCLYTGNWFWDFWSLRLGHAPAVGNPPTWLAYYNGRKDLDVPTRPSYGPIIGHQYAGTTARYGTQVDLNVFDSAWINAREETMEQEEFNRMFKEAAANVLLPARDEDGAPASASRTLGEWLSNLISHGQRITAHENRPHVYRGDEVKID